jgi:NitT/TauT family transport system substrate-binding protein
MVSRRQSLTSIAAFAAAALPFGAGAQSRDPIRVGMIPIDVAAQAFYAQDEGFFKNRNLDVDLQIASSGGAIYPAIASASLDIGAGNFVAIAQAHLHGIPLVLIAPAGSYSAKTPSAAIIVQKNSPITSAKDLSGKTIAVDSLKNLAYIAVASWAAKNGLDINAVHVAEIPMSAMGAALAAGRIDAASILEPALSHALADNDTRIIARHFDAIAPEFLEGAWFCMADYASAHRDVARRFADAMTDASKWANKNPTAAGTVLQSYSKSPPTPIAFRTFFPEHLRAADVQLLIDAAARYGVIDRTFPAADLIAPGFG